MRRYQNGESRGQHQGIRDIVFITSLLLSQHPNSETGENQKSKDDESGSRNVKAKRESTDRAKKKKLFAAFHASLPRIAKQKAEHSSRTNSEIRQVRKDDCDSEHHRHLPTPTLAERRQQHNRKELDERGTRQRDARCSFNIFAPRQQRESNKGNRYRVQVPAAGKLPDGQGMPRVEQDSLSWQPE